MTKKHILVVDDEKLVLDGIRRMLWSHRQEWELTFTQRGSEALEILNKAPVDLVVSDMRMPGINGVELLEQVKVRFPQVIRIVLSGHADKDMTLRAVGASHQYLSKPCDPEQFQTTLRRAFQLQELVPDAGLRARINGLSSLPSLPSLYVELNELVRSEDCSTRQVGELIAQDPPMTAKILQLVNSSFFGLSGRHIVSPAEAVTILGTDTVVNLVLTAGVFSQFRAKVFESVDIGAVWRHALQVAGTARDIAAGEGADAEFCQAAEAGGLLHDLGWLILADAFTAEFIELRSRTDLDLNHAASVLAELGMFNCTHAQMGAYLVALWGLPDPIVDAIAHHHQPQLAHTADFRPHACVYIANALIHAQERGQVEDMDVEYLSAIGKGGRINDWLSLLPPQQEGATNER